MDAVTSVRLVVKQVLPNGDVRAKMGVTRGTRHLPAKQLFSIAFEAATQLITFARQHSPTQQRLVGDYRTIVSELRCIPITIRSS